MADLVLGLDTDRIHTPWVNPPDANRRWEPEPLRWLGANAGLAVMSSADSREARTGRPARRAQFMGRYVGH